ncbi:MAG: hypothetical protein R6U78_17780 [Bacteroidales bacterium]
MQKITDLRPGEVWACFSEILSIPRISKKEEKIIAYVEEFAGKHDLDCSFASLYEDELADRYGEEIARQIRHVEAFEISEYGTPAGKRELERLFPF